MKRSQLAVGFGVAMLSVGLAAIVSPELVPFTPGRIAVGAVAVLALLQAIRVGLARRDEGLDVASTPDPERAIATPAPGEEFESALEQFLDGRQLEYDRGDVRNGLRTVAIASLTRFQGYSASKAKAAVAAGTWTENRRVGAFLGGKNAPNPPLTPSFRAMLRREPADQRDIRQTIDVIGEKAGLHPTADSDDAPEADVEEFDSQDRYSTTRWFDVDEHRSEERSEDDIVARPSHPTLRWYGISAVALLGIAAGLLLEQPAIVLAGVVGIGFGAYAQSSAFPPGSVAVERTISAEEADPDEEVEVTVTVTNESDRFLPDCRIVDGVPEALSVSSGSARLGTALRPGERTTISYSVRATRGEHTFDPTLLIARNLAGSVEEKRLIPAETTLTCRPSYRAIDEPIPLRQQASRYVGRVEIDRGGPGVEFYATREYRSGDTISRIDWNRLARAGTPSTIEFREERSARVIIVIDARPGAYVSPTPHDPHAVDRSVEAAGALFSTLVDTGDRVGITAVSTTSCWLAPGSDEVQRIHAREILTTDRALAPVSSGEYPSLRYWQVNFRKRISPGTQVILFSPLADKYVTRAVLQLEAYGYPVTVISPDATTDRSAGHRLAAVARALHISSLRRADIPVLDWAWDEPIPVAVAKYSARRST